MFFRAILTTTLLFIFTSSNIFASDRKSEIVDSVMKLCMAPSKDKSSFYSIMAKGKADLSVKLLGLAGAEANFKQEEWSGIQRVLQKDQLNDNKNYRDCITKITPIFVEKFSIRMNTEKEDSKPKTTDNTSQPTKNNDIMKQYFEDIEINLKSCVQKSNSIKCKFIIKNTDKKDIGVTLDPNSLIIDANGDTYHAYHSLIKFGNVEAGSPHKILVQNIPVKAEMRFNKVESQGKQIPLLKFGISSKKSRAYIEFRNIKLINTEKEDSKPKTTDDTSQPTKNNDIMKQYFEDIEISLKSCVQKSNSIKCKFIIKNTDKKDIGVSLNANSFIIDADGDTYYAYNSLIKFGNLKTSFPYKILVQNIPVKAEMRFNKVESQGKQIPLLKFGISSKKSRAYIEFRNIKLK